MWNVNLKSTNEEKIQIKTNLDTDNSYQRVGRWRRLKSAKGAKYMGTGENVTSGGGTLCNKQMI